MTENNYEILFEKCISLELAIAEMYTLFAEHTKDDRDFWKKLSLEEENHAELLKTGKLITELGKFPKGMIPESVTEMDAALDHVSNAKVSFSQQPDRFYAFEIAYTIENSIGEAHLQHYLNLKADEQTKELFKKLNKADIDHANRIKQYWDKLLFND